MAIADPRRGIYDYYNESTFPNVQVEPDDPELVLLYRARRTILYPVSYMEHKNELKRNAPTGAIFYLGTREYVGAPTFFKEASYFYTALKKTFLL
jgi:hypothetical protein